MRRPLVIYDFATIPSAYPYMRKIFFSFLSVQRHSPDTETLDRKVLCFKKFLEK
jgi:hypothetical protein